jgi:hypothetical protein
MKLAENLGFDLFVAKYEEGDNIRGLMGDWAEESPKLKSKRFIVISERRNEHGKRGTAAHELGHFFINCHEKDDFTEIYYENETEETVDEINANNFKRELLMPWMLLSKFLKDRGGRSWKEIIDDISCDFHVPGHYVKAHLIWCGYDISDLEQCYSSSCPLPQGA